MILSRILLIFSLLLLSFGGSAQTTDFAAIEKLQQQERRPLIVLIKTAWCKYCGGMKNSLTNNQEITTLIKSKFYLALLDAEDKKEILFAGRSFSYKPTGKNVDVHQLARELGSVNGQISYPTLCVLNAKNEIIYQHAGYLDPQSLIKILRLLAEGN